LSAGQEQSRIAGLAQNQAMFQNSAQQQAYDQMTGLAQFYNSAQAQQYAQNANDMQMANAAQGQSFGQNQAQTEANNAGQQQKFNQNLASGQFANAAQQQLFNNALQEAQFTNAAQEQTFGQNKAQLEANNTAQNQKFTQGLAGAEFGNSALQQQYQNQNTAMGGRPASPEQLAEAQAMGQQQAPQPLSRMELLQALGNPFLSEEQRAVLQTLYQQQVQQSDPVRLMQLERERLEIDAMRNGEGSKLDDGRLYNQRMGEVRETRTKPNAPPGLGLNSQYGVDEQGIPFLLQLGKDGKVVRSTLPDGVSLSKELGNQGGSSLLQASFDRSRLKDKTYSRSKCYSDLARLIKTRGGVETRVLLAVQRSERNSKTQATLRGRLFTWRRHCGELVESTPCLRQRTSGNFQRRNIGNIDFALNVPGVVGGLHP
jgi:hypothetical protein